jgi:hypothetical protein
VPSVEADELTSAHLRLARLEAELALTRDACALFDAQVVTGLKESRDRRRVDRTRAFRSLGVPGCLA